MVLKAALAALACLAPLASATAASSLADLMHAASACTDDRVRAYAASTCEQPTQIAALAVRDCEDKWQALAHSAVRPPAESGTSALAYKRSLQSYADGMEYEYSKIAELKVIDIRGGSDRCTAE